MPHIVLCDDHPVFVDALGVVLGRRGFTVDAVVTRVAQIAPTVARHRPEVCLIDRNFGAEDGLAQIGPILAASPRTRVLMLTADRNEATASRALAAGASGYLCKTAGIDAVVGAIRGVLAGTTAVRLTPRPAPRLSPQDADAHRLAGYTRTGNGNVWLCSSTASAATRSPSGWGCRSRRCAPTCRRC